MWKELVVACFKVLSDCLEIWKKVTGTYAFNGHGRRRKVVAYVKKLFRLAGKAEGTRAALTYQDSWLLCRVEPNIHRLILQVKNVSAEVIIFSM
jgi:hypothetical protein